MGEREGRGGGRERDSTSEQVRKEESGMRGREGGREGRKEEEERIMEGEREGVGRR